MNTCKTTLLAITLASVSIYSYTSRAAQQEEKMSFGGDSCSITCYVKTPTCYVTKTSDDCLVITNVKPSPNKKSPKEFMCTLKGCETKTEYNSSGKSETVTPNKD